MKLSAEVIEKINNYTGIIGQPYFRFEAGKEVETECYKWSQAPTLEDLQRNIPASVAEALKRFGAAQPAKRGLDPQKEMAEFFSREPLETQVAFAQYMAKVKEATEEMNPPVQQVTYSPALQGALDRINDQLSHEKFLRKGNFDTEAYLKRSKELFSAEPPEIQAELAVISQKILEANNQRQNRLAQRKIDLHSVRNLLSGENACAYRAGIEWEGVPSQGYETIVVAPTNDQFDILRIEKTQGNNHSISTEDLIAVLKEIDLTFGIDIIGAASDGVEILLNRIPKGEEAIELGKKLFSLCPDLPLLPSRFPKGKINLWWD